MTAVVCLGGGPPVDKAGDTAPLVPLPTVRELRDVIAAYVFALEPVATSDGVARAVHGYLSATGRAEI